MFIENKYYKWYGNIVEKAKSENRKKPNPYESHHIVPKCMGGKNGKENRVLLTYREHFLCHWLLTKCVTEQYKWKMKRAVGRMHGKGRTLTSWQYAVLRKAAAEAMRNRKITKKERERMRAFGKTLIGEKNGMYGRKHTDETKAKCGTRGEEHPFYNKKRPDHSAKMKIVMIGKNTWTAGRHWYTNGAENVMDYTQPAGFYPGRISQCP